VEVSKKKKKRKVSAVNANELRTQKNSWWKMGIWMISLAVQF